MTLQQYEHALGHIIRTKASLVAPDHLSVYVYGEYVTLIIRTQYTEQDMSADLGFVYYTLSNFETIHNYINFNDNITRKGAISAQKGERVLIPLNMRDGCILGVGKGNEDWNCSAPHGAGRLYSRGTAKQILTMEEFEASMEGIYTTSVTEGTLDESAMAYKPIDEILDKVGDTVDIIDILKPIYNFKAH